MTGRIQSTLAYAVVLPAGEPMYSLASRYENPIPESTISIPSGTKNLATVYSEAGKYILDRVRDHSHHTYTLNSTTFYHTEYTDPFVNMYKNSVQCRP
jgi:hypothetical protein